MLARLRTGACEKRIKTGTCVGCDEFKVCTKLERIEEAAAMRLANELSIAADHEAAGDHDALRRVLTQTMRIVTIMLGAYLMMGLDADGNGILFDAMIWSFNLL